MHVNKKLLLLAGLCVTLVACSGSSDGAQDGGPADAGDFGEGPWDEGVHIPYEEQPPGDPEAGFEALVTKGYVSCGIPKSLFSTAAGFLGDIAQREPLTDRAGLPLRTGANADMPYNWNVHTIIEDGDAVEIASLNCLQCHGGYFNGEFVLGLGDASADYTEEFGGGAASAIGSLVGGLPIGGKDALLKLIERQEAISEQATLPTVGSNPAVTIAVALASYKDAETLTWLDEPHTPLPTIRLPIDTPPWWRVKKKSTQFYNGMSRGDHKGTMMLASMLCTDTNAEAQSILEYFDDVNAFIRSIEAPSYPFAIDDAMADAGEALYIDNCAGCHGTYGATQADDWYPNLIIPTDVIGTDPTMAEYETDLEQWFEKTIYARYATVVMEAPIRGYVPPPLDGIWATAPFLHNGSVPDLATLLDSKSRPTYWKKPQEFDSTAFDQEVVGWPYEVSATSQAQAPRDEQKFIYDTTLEGHSNEGHVYGDLLTEQQRRQLIEYLKTL